jgi:hypothetical protein
MEYPNTMWKVAMKIADHVGDAKNDAGISKDQLLEEIEPLVNELMKKILSHPTTTSYCLFQHRDV